MPQIATVGLVGGFWEDGASGAPEEPAGFRRKISSWRVLRQAGGTKTTDIRAQREVVWKTTLSLLDFRNRRRRGPGQRKTVDWSQQIRLSDAVQGCFSMVFFA